MTHDHDAPTTDAAAPTATIDLRDPDARVTLAVQVSPGAFAEAGDADADTHAVLLDRFSDAVDIWFVPGPVESADPAD